MWRWQTMLLQWGFWETDCCPCCNAPNETTHHLAVCTSPALTEVFHNELAKLEEWFDKSGSHPSLAVIIVNALRTRNLNVRFVDCDSVNTTTHKAAVQQDQIGWDNLLFGRIAIGSRQIQTQHLRDTHSKRTIGRWCGNLVEHLLQLSHSLWKARNDILHERDEQCLLRDASEQVRTSILAAFAAGPNTLPGPDRYLLEDYTPARVFSLLVTDKHNWLSAVKSAQDYQEYALDTHTDRMRAFMEEYFSYEPPPP